MFLRVFLIVCTLLCVLTIYGQKHAHEKKVTRSAVTERQPSPVLSQKQMEVYLRNRFRDAPVLVHIARCESSFRHTLRDGTVLRGRVNSADVGVMQINLDAHGERLKKYRLNPLNLEDNVRYARILYREKGTQPWSASERCWGQKFAQK